MTSSTWAILIGFLLISSNSFAGLGEDESAVDRDHAAIRSLRHDITENRNFRVHTLTRGDGSTVNEYAAHGNIFAVTWQGSGKHPDLSTLLGKYYAEFRQAASGVKTSARGRPFSTVKTDHIVVSVGGHLGHVQGRAVVPEMVPDGLNTDDLK